MWVLTVCHAAWGGQLYLRPSSSPQGVFERGAGRQRYPGSEHASPGNAEGLLEQQGDRRVSSTPSYLSYPCSEHASPGTAEGLLEQQGDRRVSSTPSCPCLEPQPRLAHAVQQQIQNLGVHTEFTPPEQCTYLGRRRFCSHLGATSDVYCSMQFMFLQ